MDRVGKASLPGETSSKKAESQKPARTLLWMWHGVLGEKMENLLRGVRILVELRVDGLARPWGVWSWPREVKAFK